MARRIGFKVSILTPWTLLPGNLSAGQCADEHADKFADVLSNRIRTELLRFAFWPRVRGEAYICSSFDAFQERFLQYSEYAVIVLSGHHVSCLDSIYPRLLVFFTMRPSWSARFLLVFLGEPKGPFRFDTGILKHDPIIFNGSSEDHWSSDEQSWNKLFSVLKADYRSPSLEDFKNIKPKGWMSVTDLRGHHLAVKLVQTPHPSYMKPSSWNDLRFCDTENSRKQLRDRGQQTLGLNFVSQSKPELGVKRYRTDSENSDQYDSQHRSASLPHLPITCISTASGTVRSSASPRLNSDLSPYMRRHAKPRFNEDPMKIEENEEEVAVPKETSEDDFQGVQLSVSSLNNSLRPDGTKAVVMPPLTEENLDVTPLEYTEVMAHQVEQNLTPSSSMACHLGTLVSGNVATSLDGYAPSKNSPVSTVVEGIGGISHNDEAPTTLSAEEHNKITGVVAKKNKPYPCVCPESVLLASRSPTDISSNPAMKSVMVRASSSSDSVLNAAPQTPPPSPIDIGLYPTKLVSRISSLKTSPKDGLDFASENTNDSVSSDALAEQSKPYANPGADLELYNETNAETLKEATLDSEANESLVPSRFTPEDKEREEKNLSTSGDSAYSNSAETDTDTLDLAVDKMSEIKSGSNSPVSFLSTDFSGHEPALKYAPMSYCEHVQVKPTVPESSTRSFNKPIMTDYANDDITEPISVSLDKQSDISQISHEEQAESLQSGQQQKETPLSEISDDREYSGFSEDLQWMNLESGSTAFQSEVQDVTGSNLVECEEAKHSENDYLGQVILVSNQAPKLYAKPPDTGPLGDIYVEQHDHSLGEERQVSKEKSWSSMTVDNHAKDIMPDETPVFDSYDYREFVENERMGNPTVACNSVEAGEAGCLLKMLPDARRRGDQFNTDSAEMEAFTVTLNPLVNVYHKSPPENLSLDRRILNDGNVDTVAADHHEKQTHGKSSPDIDENTSSPFVTKVHQASSEPSPEWLPSQLRNTTEHVDCQDSKTEPKSDTQIQLENSVVTESSGETLESSHNQVTSSSKTEPHILTSSSFLGTENLDQQGQQVSSSRREIVAFGQTFGQRRPRIWSLAGLISLADFVTAYIPRNLRWFYASIFQSREEMMDVMAGPTFTMQVHDGFRNPIYVSLAFFGIATASPHISRWPQLVAYLFGSSGVYLYARTIRTDRPILSSLERVLPWGGSVSLT